MLNLLSKCLQTNRVATRLLSRIGFAFAAILLSQTTAQAQSSPPNEVLWEWLHLGWPRSIEEGLRTQNSQQPSLIEAHKNYIILYGRTPSTPLDLRSPEHMKWGINAQINDLIANDTHGGHLMVGWHCQTAQGLKKGMTGMSGESSKQTNRMLKDGWGLSSYVATFTDGHLQVPAVAIPPASGPTHEENTLQWYFSRDLRNKSDFSFFVVEVEQQQCERGRKFIFDFLNHHDKPMENFGALPDPLKFEGGACLSFAQAVLTHAGVFENILPHLKRKVQLPEHLLGTASPDSLPAEVSLQRQVFLSRPREVSLLELFNVSWNPYLGSRNVEFDQVDPELFYLFYRELGEGLLRSQPPSLTDPNLRRAFRQRRIIHSLNHSISSQPFSQEPIDLDYDVHFGGNAGRISDEAQAMVRSGGDRMNIFPFHHGHGIKIDLKPH